MSSDDTVLWIAMSIKIEKMGRLARRGEDCVFVSSDTEEKGAHGDVISGSKSAE
jgi:hypothetical protein